MNSGTYDSFREFNNTELLMLPLLLKGCVLENGSVIA